jgi:hypothetical protein
MPVSGDHETVSSRPLSRMMRALLSIHFAVEKFLQHDSLVVLGIFGTVNQRQRSVTRQLKVMPGLLLELSSG